MKNDRTPFQIRWRLARDKAFKERFYDLYEMIPGFIAGFFCTISVSLMTDVDRDIADEVDSVRRAVGPVF